MLGDALPGQVGERRFGRAQEQRRQVVGHDPVDLFGHPPVVAAQACFDVRDRDVQLGADQRAGQRGVRVAVDEQPVRLLLDRDGLDARQHRPGLHPVPARADLQVGVRRGDVELAEEQVRHRFVVVLAGVEQELLVLAAKGLRNGRGFDELRSRADHRENLHG